MAIAPEIAFVVFIAASKLAYLASNIASSIPHIASDSANAKAF